MKGNQTSSGSGVGQWTGAVAITGTSMTATADQLWTFSHPGAGAPDHLQPCGHRRVLGARISQVMQGFHNHAMVPAHSAADHAQNVRQKG